eukprot:ctg_411.g213
MPDAGGSDVSRRAAEISAHFSSVRAPAAGVGHLRSFVCPSFQTPSGCGLVDRIAERTAWRDCTRGGNASVLSGAAFALSTVHIRAPCQELARQQGTRGHQRYRHGGVERGDVCGDPARWRFRGHLPRGHVDAEESGAGGAAASKAGVGDRGRAHRSIPRADATRTGGAGGTSTASAASRGRRPPPR